MIQKRVLFWDDTVIMINTQRACMRFYGDEQISCYTAHEKKDLDSLIEDHVPDLLTDGTVVMHDLILPTTNNLSERGLRGIKSHMKISGQFENEMAAKNYAIVKTYVERSEEHTSELQSQR